ncbi:MAG: hypothetical protein IKD72_06050, partial [Clostridia bacterium]|nr:hypothetical protein [Clostridia bacterium]
FITSLCLLNDHFSRGRLPHFTEDDTKYIITEAAAQCKHELQPNGKKKRKKRRPFWEFCMINNTQGADPTFPHPAGSFGVL